MNFYTIDRVDCIKYFDAIMQNNSKERILFIEGSEGMGKTHLLASVFRGIAREQYNARCISIDFKLDGLILNLSELAC